MPPDQKLADAIRRLREERALNQEEVAFEADLTVGSYARIERGEANPAWTTVVRIANGLGVTVADLAAEAKR